MTIEKFIEKMKEIGENNKGTNFIIELLKKIEQPKDNNEEENIKVEE